MVILGKRRERGDEEAEEESMDTGPERSKPLHNFSMPCLKWGKQRFLRCMKLNTNGGDVVSAAAVDRRSSASEMERAFFVRSVGRSAPDHKRLRKSPFAGGGNLKVDGVGDDGIEAVRTKLMFDLQTAAARMKVAILREDVEDEEQAAAAGVSPAPVEADVARPWNLRTRRAACKEPNGIVGGGGGGRKSLKIDDRKPNFSPARTESKSPRLRADAAADPSGETGEKKKFSVSLSRREIAEDFVAMTGQRPPRRPKKRAKIVQRQLDTLFPGLWLGEITADSYKVSDVPETGKR